MERRDGKGLLAPLRRLNLHSLARGRVGALEQRSRGKTRLVASGKMNREIRAATGGQGLERTGPVNPAEKG